MGSELKGSGTIFIVGGVPNGLERSMFATVLRSGWAGLVSSKSKLGFLLEAVLRLNVIGGTDRG